MIQLDWPPKELSPNQRKDRRAIAGIRKNYKRTCWALAKASKDVPTDHLKITFHPPDGRHRDTDNMLASIKSGLDGMCQGFGIDDRRFVTLTLVRGAPVKPSGVVFVEFV